MAGMAHDESMRYSSSSGVPRGDEVDVGGEAVVEEEEQGVEMDVVHANAMHCTLQSLQLAVLAGFESRFFMGPLGEGPPWHEWREQHLVALLGAVGHNLRRSEASDNTTSWSQFKRIVEEKFGVVWGRKFVEPDLGSKTKSLLSILEGARGLDSRWDQVCWLFFDWSLCQLQVIATPMAKYWFMPYLMLNNPVMRVHTKFVRALGDKLLLWADGWVRGEGGLFIKRDLKLERLPPGMRFAEVAEFSVEFLRRLEVLRAHPEEHFGDLLAFARESLEEAEMESFMQNFSSDDGFFATTAKTWRARMDRYQHLPLSMARIACSSFRVDAWAEAEKASERAVGQEFAMAFLAVLWPEELHAQQQQQPPPRTQSEGEIRGILEKDLEGTTTTEQRDKLTLGMYSKLKDDAGFRAEVARYAASACGERELVSENGMDEEEREEGGPGVVGVTADAVVSSGFAPISDFPRLYREACHTIYFVPIHMQLIESFLDMFASRTRKSAKPSADDSEDDHEEDDEDSDEDSDEDDALDLVRMGQFRSAESRHITRKDAAPKDILDAGKKAMAEARASKR